MKSGKSRRSLMLLDRVEVHPGRASGCRGTRRPARAFGSARCHRAPLDASPTTRTIRLASPAARTNSGARAVHRRRSMRAWAFVPSVPKFLEPVQSFCESIESIRWSAGILSRGAETECLRLRRAPAAELTRLGRPSSSRCSDMEWRSRSELRLVAAPCIER